MRVFIHRTKMATSDPACTYDAEVPIEDVPNYDPGRYTTIIHGGGPHDGKRFVSFVEATLPESHFAMPQGFERYDHFLEHERAIKSEALRLLHTLYPETCGLERFPTLWVGGIDQPHDSRWIERP